MKAIFLDKDGTLVDDLPYNVEPRRIRLVSGAGAALRLLARLDYRFFVITNQSGIAHGCFGEEAMGPVADRLADLLFRDEPDVRNLIKMKAIYEVLETVTDRCEDVANIIEGIIVENA